MVVLNALNVAAIVAIFACSFASTPAYALSAHSHHFARQARGHDLINPLKKRSTALTKRCKAKTPTHSSSAVSAAKSSGSGSGSSKAVSGGGGGSSNGNKVGLAWTSGNTDLANFKTDKVSQYVPCFFLVLIFSHFFSAFIPGVQIFLRKLKVLA
jgi:hypothetical protein